MSAEIPTLLTFKQFAEKYAHLWTVPSLRWLRFHDQTNGFGGVFIRVGRRLLIDEAKFFVAIERMNQPASHQARLG